MYMNEVRFIPTVQVVGSRALMEVVIPRKHHSRRAELHEHAPSVSRDHCVKSGNGMNEKREVDHWATHDRLLRGRPPGPLG